MPKPFDNATPRGAPADAHAPDATAAYEQPAIPPRPRGALPAVLFLLLVAAALAYLRPWESRALAGRAAADSTAAGTLQGQAEGEARAPTGAEPEFGPGMPLPRAEAEEGAYELSRVTVLPRPLNIPDLRRFMLRNYPPLLRDSGVQGTVQVRFRIEPDGRVDASTIDVTVSSEPAFNLIAVRAVEMLRFSPAEVDGRPVRVWAELPIQFQVE